MKKFTETEKRSIVVVFEQGKSIQALATECQVTKRCIYLWIQHYSDKRIQKARYSPETQQNIVRLYESGVKIAELAKRFNISEALAYHYLNKYRDQLNDGLRKELKRCHDDAQMQDMENQIFKLSGCSLKSSADDKIKAVEELKEQFGICVCPVSPI